MMQTLLDAINTRSRRTLVSIQTKQFGPIVSSIAQCLAPFWYASDNIAGGEFALNGNELSRSGLVRGQRQVKAFAVGMVKEESGLTVAQSNESFQSIADDLLEAAITKPQAQPGSDTGAPLFSATTETCEGQEVTKAAVAGTPPQTSSVTGLGTESESERPSIPDAADELVERALDEDRSLASVLNADGPVRWPSVDALLHQVTCSLERRYLLHPGTMYISERYLCFQLSVSHGPSFLEAAAAAGASASNFLSFGYRSSPSTQSEPASTPSSGQRLEVANDRRPLSATRHSDSLASAPVVAAGEHEVLTSASPPPRMVDTGYPTLWLVPFEAVTSVRKSSYLYLESALEVSTTFGLCNHTRHGGVFWTQPEATPSAVKVLRFAAFSDPNRDIVYQFVMKAWMARLSLLALQGRLPLTIQDPARQQSSIASGKSAVGSGPEAKSRSECSPEATADRTPASTGMYAAPNISEASPNSPKTLPKETQSNIRAEANGMLGRENGVPVAVEIAYDIDAGQILLELPPVAKSRISPEERVFQMFFADASPVPRQLNERLGHTELQMSLWQRMDTSGDKLMEEAPGFVPCYRTISYQVTVRRGLLSFTGHCTESQMFRSTPLSLRDPVYPYGALYEISVLTRDMPSSDTFLVRQRIFFDISTADSERWHVRVRAALGIQWLGRTVWRPFIERSVASQSRHAFELMGKLMVSRIESECSRDGAAQLQEDGSSLTRRPLGHRYWTQLRENVQLLCQSYSRIVLDALGRLSPPLLYRLFLFQTILIMMLSALCGFLLARVISRIDF
jgi:hypothetical protein